MDIWSQKHITIEDLNEKCKDTMAETLAMRFTEIGDDYLKIEMPVNKSTHQPYGLLHGGASAALAETVGSVASALCIDSDKQICVGIEINCNHVRGIKEGMVTATARPLHLGGSTHVWDIKITNNKEQLICVSRLTVAILKKAFSLKTMPISVCILINEWRPIVLKVIESYAGCCSEILLGANGDFSFEDYPELLQNSKVKGLSLDWKGYGQTKNELAQHAENDWILSVDADEVADEKLQQALLSWQPESKDIIYALGRCHHLAERPVRHGAWSMGKQKIFRLYNRNYTQWDEAEVHEKIRIPEGARIIPLAGQMNHYTADSYEEFIAKNRHYACLSAQKYRQQGKALFPGKSWLSAGFGLIKDYVFRLGFLDGRAGWQVAKGNALYTFWKYHFMKKK